MKVPNLVIGQAINPDKVADAKWLRREMTPAERVLWGHLRRSPLPGLHFRRQQVVDGFIVDFYCHAAGVVVEVDGPLRRGQAEEDAVRETILHLRGLRIVRFSNQQVLENPTAVVAEISDICREEIARMSAADSITPSHHPVPE